MRVKRSEKNKNQILLLKKIPLNTTAQKQRLPIGSWQVASLAMEQRYSEIPSKSFQTMETRYCQCHFCWPIPSATCFRCLQIEKMMLQNSDTATQRKDFIWVMHLDFNHNLTILSLNSRWSLKVLRKYHPVLSKWMYIVRQTVHSAGNVEGLRSSYMHRGLNLQENWLV